MWNFEKGIVCSQCHWSCSTTIFFANSQNSIELRWSPVQPIWRHLIRSLVDQRLKPLPAMQETWVRSLCREDPLEKEMATHSSILTWRIPWTEEPGGPYSLWSPKESDRTEQLRTHTHTNTRSPSSVPFPYTAKSQSMLASITVLPVNTLFFSGWH